ncbi:MAG: hypothetical protein OXQ90_01605 [Gammaproteobacteria bacterium]|nr:hypothetical protein [Gammaproteobacteria bacterium]
MAEHKEGVGTSTGEVERKKAYKSVIYPGVALSRCVDNATEIEGKYGTARIERKVAAELLGYKVGKKGLHGTATKALTAMSAFGLIESVGRGSIRVTSQAKRVIYPASDEEMARDLTALAFHPPLFSIIRDRFDGAELVPQDGVVAFLMQENYEPRYVRPAAKSYVDTIRYLLGKTGSASLSVEKSDTDPPDEPKPAVKAETMGVALILQAAADDAELPAITIQLPDNGRIIGSKALKNMIGLLQAYQPILEAAESDES